MTKASLRCLPTGVSSDVLSVCAFRQPLAPHCALKPELLSDISCTSSYLQLHGTAEAFPGFLFRRAFAAVYILSRCVTALSRYLAVR